MAHFDGCLEAIDQNSSNAKVFVLIHKMDLVPEDQRERVRGHAGVLVVIRRTWAKALVLLLARTGV
jgi:hypothetical protein